MIKRNIMTFCKYLTVVCLFLFIACKSDSNADDRSAPVQDQTATPVATSPAAPAVNQQVTPPAEPAQNADGVWHFTCSNNCGGGAGAGGACPDCGAPLEHNKGYHANAATPTINPTTAPSVLAPSVTQVPGGGQAIQVTPPAEPSQNTTGVWHFTCPNGCAGGGGSAAACSGCGTTLVHNTIYHQ